MAFKSLTIPSSILGGALGWKPRNSTKLVNCLASPSTRPLTADQTPAALPTLVQNLQQIAADVAKQGKPYFDYVHQTYIAPVVAKNQPRLQALDERWQTFVYTRIDPLLGATRQQQLSELAVSLSPQEKAINRRLGFAVANAGVAFTGEFLFRPLLLLNAVVSVWIGYPYYIKGIKVFVTEGRVDYFFLIVVSEIITIVGAFFAPGSLYALFFVLSLKLINHTQSNFRRTLTDGLGQQPRTVWCVVDGVEVEVPFTQIRSGDILVVDAGQLIPVDGMITQGAAAIDQRALTGEAQPAEKGVGDTVLASTIVLTGKIYIAVEKAGEETVAAQIALILQRTTGYRLNFNSKVEKFANDSAVWLLGAGGLAWVTNNMASCLTILNAGVGTSARLNGPLAMLNYLNLTSHAGVLIKDARSFELLKLVDVVVFDKTGTLTLEQPTVARIHRLGEVSEDEILAYAAAAERRQSHPIAQAILAAARQRALALPEIEAARYELGFGITVTVDKRVVHVGSQRFMAQEQIAVDTTVQQWQDQCHEQGHSLVMVAFDGQLVGALELQPTIRPQAQQAVKALQQRGLAVYIISGDHEAPTRQLAQTLGVDHYFASVLPQDKSALVEALQREGHKVCFVGDGINDALALGRADVSISLRGATTIAMDTAQVVLMNQDLGQLPFLLDIARSFHRTLQQIFYAGLAQGAAIIGGVFLFHISIYAGSLLWQLGVLGGVGFALLPLYQYRQVGAGNQRALPVQTNAETG